MNVNAIKFTAVDVKTDSGICVGLAKTQKGEEYIMDGRTPESPGMCSNAFCALANAAFIMMVNDTMPGEKDGYIERVCPHILYPSRILPSGSKNYDITFISSKF